MLYHKNIGFPSSIRVDIYLYSLKYGNHARYESLRDRYGIIKLPLYIDLRLVEIIEIETFDNTNIDKFVCRMSYNNDCDITVVFKSDGFVKTVWLNKKTDIHKTLDRTRYDVPVKKGKIL